MRETLRAIVHDASSDLRVVHVWDTGATLCGVQLRRPVGVHEVPAGFDRCAECTRGLIASPDR